MLFAFWWSINLLPVGIYLIDGISGILNFDRIFEMFCWLIWSSVNFSRGYYSSFTSSPSELDPSIQGHHQSNQANWTLPSIHWYVISHSPSNAQDPPGDHCKGIRYLDCCNSHRYMNLIPDEAGQIAWLAIWLRRIGTCHQRKNHGGTTVLWHYWW